MHMRKTLPEKLEESRVRIGDYGSNSSNGIYGAFKIWGPCGEELCILASGGEDEREAGWEHVSVSTHRRCPNWKEMCFIESLFWEPEECVVQFHPPKSEWINNHSFCLHLWRHKTIAFPKPPAILVGVKSVGVIKTPEQARAVRDAMHKTL